jgi:trigger factor
MSMPEEPETEQTVETEPEVPETSIEVEEPGPCKRVLKISVPVEKVQLEIEKSYKELGSNLAYPGFRKGKVPRQILEKRFGDQIRDEVKDGLLQSTFEEALESKELSPLGEPEFDKIEFEASKPFTYEVKLSVRPEFELGEYKGIQVEEPDTEPAEAEIEAALNQIRQGRAELVPAEDGVSQAGDYLIADIGLYVEDEEVFLEEEASLRVGGDTIMGVQDQKILDFLVGAKVDERREVEVPLADDFREEKHRGKTGKFTLLPKEVKRIKLPELDDDFAKELKFESAEELREETVSRLRAQKAAEKPMRIENDIVERILAGLDLPLPDDILEKEADAVAFRTRLRLLRLGMQEEQIEKHLEEERPRSKESIGRNLREMFVLEKIAEAEKIFVTEDEVDQHLTARAEAYGSTLADMKQEMRSSGELAGLRMEMRHEKVRAFLREHAKVSPRENDPQGSPDD